MGLAEGRGAGTARGAAPAPGRAVCKAPIAPGSGGPHLPPCRTGRRAGSPETHEVKWIRLRSPDPRFLRRPTGDGS